MEDPQNATAPKLAREGASARTRPLAARARTHAGPWAAGVAVIAPCLLLVAYLAEHGTGFLVQDDWNVYLTSFAWLIEGDLTVLWASVAEHRVVLSRVLHFLEYTVVGDSRALLFVSPLFQLAFAFAALRRLEADRPFSGGLPGTALRVAACLFFSALLFSPIQAWAFARTAYLEIFGLLLGALIFFLGLTRWRLGVTLGGLLLAAASTPGWLALIAMALVFLAWSALFARREVPLGRQLRFALPLLAACGALAVLYLLPFDHPNNSGAHPPLTRTLAYAASHPGQVFGQYLAFLGFPVAVAGLTAPLDGEVTPEKVVGASRVFGLAYLAVTALLVALRLRARRGLDLATTYLVFTAGLALSIVVARTPILGDHAVVNYAYSAYVVPGWAFVLYLWVRWFDEGRSELRLPALRDLVAAGAVALVLVAASYQRGRGALSGTLTGQQYLQSLYVESFLSPATEEARWEAARVLDHPDPERVFEGTAILLEHDLVPRNWTAE